MNSFDIIANESPQNWLASQPPEEWAKFLRRLKPEELAALDHQWRGWHARPHQLAPPGDWTTWLISTGRGWGKTRSGAEWVRELVEREAAGHIALVGETEADARNVMVEGDSGLLRISPPEFAPRFEASKRRLTWPSGARASLYSAEDPEQLRGPQHDAAWCDEPAKWRYGMETWDNLEFGLRLGQNPRIVATTTPRPTAFIRRLLQDPRTVVTRGSTFDNVGNLSEKFLRRMKERYDGTRLGRQELYAELLEEVEGALWQHQRLEQHRVRSAPPLQRVVVGIDPAVSCGPESNETGIVVAGRGEDGHLYVLEDASCRASPDRWAKAAIQAYHRHHADRIVAETNNGGQMVEQVLRTVWPAVPYRAVHASKGKVTRAEPVAAVYEQGRVHHVGLLAALEDQMCAFVPGQLEESPDRVDALVWCLTELIQQRVTPQIYRL